MTSLREPKRQTLLAERTRLAHGRFRSRNRHFSKPEDDNAPDIGNGSQVLARSSPTAYLASEQVSGRSFQNENFTPNPKHSF